ncbi:MAG: hypothetical protein L0H96_25675, partial [Humibacillus sp.]|nr:hypothetical protein [Humibacillus sp.]
MLAVLLVAALGVGAPPSMAVVPAGAAGFAVPAASPVDPARAAVPDAVSPRIAFTAARDAIATVSVTSGEGTNVDPTDASVTPVTPAPVHEGELSSNHKGDQAFVSTRDDPHGEVYVLIAGSSRVPATPVRLTCHNTAVESHPVISPDGTRLVYAATNASGISRLRLVMLDPNLAALDPEGSKCPKANYELRGAPSGADTWPTWLSDQWIAFSSTSSDPLGDIWAQYVGSATPPQPNSAIRLTTGPAAETQPASVDWFLEGPKQTVLMFTTTQFRADGSIGAMTLPNLSAAENTEDLLAGADTAIYSPWTGAQDSPPQGTEAALTQNARGGINLAVSTSDGDPYGNIVAVIGNDDDFSGNHVALPPPFGAGDSHVDIADVPGRAETQPAWLPDPDGGTGSDSQLVSYTERTPTATVADVRAADGSGRRTIANETGNIGGDITIPLDESTPAYSPDGTRIAYSRIGPEGQGREIVVSAANGTAPVSVDRSRPAAAFDSEPAWSPDGARVAFIRTYLCSEACPFHGSKLWIAEVSTHTARLVTVDPAGTVAWDQHPSWSPNGSRVVISRTLEAPPDLAASFAVKSLTVENGATVDVALTVTNRGLGRANDVRFSLPGAVGGGPFSVFVDSDPSCSGDDYYGQTCAVATIPAGSSQTWSIRVTGTLVGEDGLTIDPTVFGQPSETKTSNNAASIPVTVTTSATPVPTLPPPAPTTGTGAALAAPVPTPPQQAGEAGIREVFASPPTGEPSTLWVLDAASGAGHQLSAAAPKTCKCVRTIEGRSPAWSPDGMQVAYEHHGSVRLLQLADPQGAAIAVTDEVPHVQMVTGFTKEYQQEIGLAKTTGGPTPSRATISAAQDPAWSPDGAWIVLSGQPAGVADNPGVYRLRPTGTDPTVVTQEAGPETEPAWQPWASLAVTLTTSAASVNVGSHATLTATVTNPGPGTSTGTVLAMALPAGLTPGTLPSGCVSAATATGSLVTCTVGSMRTKTPVAPATGPVPDTVVVLIPVTGTVLGPYTVTAAVGSVSPDDLASDNEASTSITVAPPPST